MKGAILREILKGQKIACCIRRSSKEQESKRRPQDYKKADCSKKESILFTVEGAALFGGLGGIFFRELLPSIIIAFAGSFYYVKNRQEKKKEKRREQLGMEFVQGAQAYSNALEAGYSKENAVFETIRYLKGIYQKETLILTEFIYMQKQLSVNQTVESLFLELGERSGIEDIHTFGEVFAAAGRKGGNLVAVIKKTVGIMKEKQALLQEIRTQTAAKRLEFGIMCIMVPGMVLYLQIFSPGFLDILYHNLIGRLFMGTVLGVYFGAIYLGERIIRVEI